MFGTLVRKELRGIIGSPKFSVTFAVCSLLILLSVFTGIQEYRADVRGWETALRLTDDQAREATSWNHLRYQALRKPDPLQILVSGIAPDIGRWSEITSGQAVKLRHSAYSDDPIFALFRMVDFAFIVQIVLSLLAILFTYDAVSGEREAGTLKLIFANGVPRATYLAAKCVGSWLGLTVPLLVPVLLGLLLIMAYGIPLTSLHWLKITALIGTSALFFTLFIVLGVLVSTLTRRTNVSFLICLVVWVTTVLIIPRAGMMAAGQLIGVPRVAEIEGKRDGYAKDLWKAHYEGMEKRFQEERQQAEATDADPQSDEAMWSRMMREDSLRKAVEREIETYETRLLEDLRRRKRTQTQLAFALSRISPASSYRLAAMKLAGTDVDLKERYEGAMSEYRSRWVDYVEEQAAAAESPGGFVSVEISSEEGLKIGTGREEGIDVTDMPRFQPPVQSFAGAFAPVMTDLGVLSLGTLLAFVSAFIAFLRYDVR